MPAGSARLLRPLTALALALALGGCEWFRTMSDPPDIQPHEREPWAPPAASIPLGGDPEFNLADVDQVGLSNPRPADSTSVAVGEAYFRSFCAVCHGATGLGDGSISDKFPAIPALNTPLVVGRSDAYVYALITQGRGLMPEYSRIPRTARWDIVNFVRTFPAAPAEVAPDAAAAVPDTTGGGTR